MKTKTGRTLEEIVIDIQPLVRGFARLQVDWFAERLATDPDGPYNEEVLISLMAMANAYAKAMLDIGATDERLNELADIGRTLGDLVTTQHRQARGLDA